MRVGIAGAGIMGQLMALSLLHAGWTVTLFDQSASSNCSMAAAGLLAPMSELEKSDLSIYHKGLEALTLHWPKIITLLNKPIYFKTSGSLVISHPRDHEELNRFITLISAKFSNKLFAILKKKDINTLEPEINKFNHGVYFQQEGHIDNQQLLKVLEDYLIQQGVIFHKNSTVSEIAEGQIILQENPEKNFIFDLVIDCRGLGAKKIFKDLRGIRGELMWLHAPDVHITRPIRFLHPRYGLYIVPRPNQIYLIGASEIEAEDYSEISVQTTLELLTAAYSVHAGFSEARVIKTLSHCRPTLIHHKPEIKYAKRFIAINGLYRHGFLIAPTLAHEVMQNL